MMWNGVGCPIRRPAGNQRVSHLADQRNTRMFRHCCALNNESSSSQEGNIAGDMIDVALTAGGPGDQGQTAAKAPCPRSGQTRSRTS